ncbi:PH domain-containing protein [Sutcliffiella horikoshii]|uniref:PH domain-containing protein n=1 Tax=Sutcliffiella horikoshii TaxID=79883 RepID=UPI00384C47EE
MMSEKKRMHPAAIVVAFFKQLRELLFPIIIFVFFGSSSGEGFFGVIYIAVMVLWFAGLIAIGVISWYRFYYWIEDGELRMEYGVFVKKRRFIPQERIQTLDTSEGIIQRIFGLVKVQIETAGGGTEAEASLTAVTKEEASRLREALLYYKNKAEALGENLEVYGPKLPIQQEPNEEPVEKPTYKASWKTLFIVGTTSGGIGVVLSAVIAFTSQFDQIVPYEDIIDRFGMVLQTSVYFIASIVFVVLFMSWLISIVMTMFKYGNFTVTKHHDELQISRGIIEKRQLTISLKKIQAIRISQNILRQPFGYATVYVESAGSSGGKESDFSTILFPLLKVSEVEAHLKEFVPSYLLTQEVHGLPKRSVIRYLIRLMVPAALLSIPIAYFFQPYGYLAFLSVAVAGLLGYSQYKAAGWAMENEQLQLSYRHLSKNTVLVRKKRIQSFELRESFFQGKRKLFTIKAAIKTGLGGKNFQVVDVEQQDGEQIYEWYSYEKKQGDVM